MYPAVAGCLLTGSSAGEDVIITVPRHTRTFVGTSSFTPTTGIHGCDGGTSLCWTGSTAYITVCWKRVLLYRLVFDIHRLRE